MYFTKDNENPSMCSFKNEPQRLRLYAVRDSGLLSYPPTPMFERGRMLELPLKPLLNIAVVALNPTPFSGVG